SNGRSEFGIQVSYPGRLKQRFPETSAGRCVNTHPALQALALLLLQAGALSFMGASYTDTMNSAQTNIVELAGSSSLAVARRSPTSSTKVRITAPK
ncbi:hypothetical protein ACPF8X_39085, partial [Streptomyces sp. G35A]